MRVREKFIWMMAALIGGIFLLSGQPAEAKTVTMKNEFASQYTDLNVYIPSMEKFFDDKYFYYYVEEHLSRSDSGIGCYLQQTVNFMPKPVADNPYLVNSGSLNYMDNTYDMPYIYDNQLYGFGENNFGYTKQFIISKDDIEKYKFDYDGPNLPNCTYEFDCDYVSSLDWENVRTFNGRKCYPLWSTYRLSSARNGLIDRTTAPYGLYFSTASNGTINCVPVAVYTNLPIFDSKEDGEAYQQSGDASKAANYSTLSAEPKWSKDDMYLSNVTYKGKNLTVRPVKDAFAEYSYIPVYDESKYTDVKLNILYSYQWSYEVHANAPDLSGTWYSTYEESIPINECKNAVLIYPEKASSSSDGLNPFKKLDTAYMFGGDITWNAGIAAGLSIGASGNVAKVTGSWLTVTMTLSGKYKGDLVTGAATIEEINLLTYENEETVAHPDDEGNYKQEDTSKKTDKDGNVTVINKIDTGGDSSGGGSSSATGGSSSATANAKVGDITTNINIPENFNINMKVDGTFNIPQLDAIAKAIQNSGGGGGGSGGGSSGGDSSSDSGMDDNDRVSFLDRFLAALKTVFDFLLQILTEFLDGIAKILGTFVDGIKEFISYLMDGFGFFNADSGIVQLLQANFSFIPGQYWQIIIWIMALCVVVGVLRKFF